MKKIILTAQLLLLTIIIWGTDTTRIVILHTNDMHAKIDNMAKIAFQIDSIKSLYKNVFVVSAGDMFTGNPIVDKYKTPGYPMIDLLNKLGYNVSCIGNHEFDYGQAIFNDRVAQANFPFICANVNANNAVMNQLPAFTTLKTDNGITIGFLGLLQLDDNGMPAASPLHFDNLLFINVMKHYAEYKKYEDSANIVIALSHLGVDDDLKLAGKLTFFDAIIGGHTHTKLYNGEKRKNTLVVQAGSYNQYMGVLTILYSEGNVISVTDSLIDIEKTYSEKQSIRKLIDEYNDNPAFDRIIGYAAEPLNGRNELGAMMTDAMRDTLGVDIAFQNSGGIRVHSIPKGGITIKQILELSPFGNTFVTYNLTTSQIKKLIRYTYNLEKHNELFVSGITFEIELKPNEDIKSIILRDYSGNELENKTYSVAINNYMALAYDLKFLKNGVETNILDASTTMDFISKNKTINYKGVKRVTIR